MNAYDRSNVGLGRTVTTELIEIAKKEGLEFPQPSVYATNKKGLQVYQKCGFKGGGRLTRHIKVLDGAYTDRRVMELLLK